MKLFSLHILAALVLASACGGPVEISPVDSGQGLSVAQAQPSSSPALKALMVCTGDTNGVHQRYEVYTWADDSVLSTCEVSDARREASGNHLYGASDGSAEAAWAFCSVDLPEPLTGATSTVWRFTSHRALNAGGVSYGGLEPGSGLHCIQVPLTKGCATPF